jgi:hypothetical protein
LGGAIVASLLRGTPLQKMLLPVDRARRFFFKKIELGDYSKLSISKPIRQ